MNKETFSTFVTSIVSKIEHLSSSQPDRFTLKTSPTECEKIVLEVSKDILLKSNVECTIEYTEGGYSFPDIVYRFNDGFCYGLEIKSSVSRNTPENSWTTLGNSILGSTRVDVLDIYIIYIKINKKGTKIRSARYEDAVSDVVVTHSPRYKINLSQDPKDSFFCKSGISYKEMNESSNPIGLVTDYFRKKGQTAWWLSESSSAVIKDWSDLTKKEKKEIYGNAFLFFPELLSNNSTLKYKRFSKWLASSYSVVDSSLRDKFTAGGRVDLLIQETPYEYMPKIILVFQDNIEAFTEAMKTTPIEYLQKYWENYEPEVDNYTERKKYWISEIKTLVPFKSYGDQQTAILQILI